MLGLSFPAESALRDVTSFVTIEQTSLEFSSTLGVYVSTVKIRNVSGNRLNPPLRLVVAEMPGSASLNSASHLTPQGKPAHEVMASGKGLEPGETHSGVTVRFHNPDKAKFTPVYRVLANSNELPPDPGKAARATLEGVDANLNGIRDDVEIAIAKSFGASPKLREALNQYAQTVQMGLLSRSKGESMQAANVAGRALECLESVAPGDRSWKTVQTLMVNTQVRMTAWRAHNRRLNGQIFPARSARDWRGGCTIDPGLFDKLNSH